MHHGGNDLYPDDGVCLSCISDRGTAGPECVASSNPKNYSDSFVSSRPGAKNLIPVRKTAKRGEFRVHHTSPSMGFYVGSYPMCWAKPRNYDINKHGLTDVRSEVTCPRCLAIFENRHK